MLRIARTKKSIYLPASGGAEEQHLGQYQELIKLIKKFLSPVTATIFAEPVFQSDGDTIEWYSDLQGQPIPLLSLSESQQTQAKKLLNDRISAISSLAERLPQLQAGSEKLQLLLQKAIQFPGDSAVYVVNDQPVITFWSITGQTRQTLNSTAPAVTASTVLPPDTKRKNPRLLSYFGWLLVLALMAGMLWYWLSNHPVDWQDYNPFEDKYQSLLTEVNEAGNDCVALKNIYNNNPLIQKEEEKFKQLKKQIESKLTVCEAYAQLIKDLESAKDNCQKLKEILAGNPYLQNPQEPFIELKKRVESESAICEAYTQLKKEIESAQGDCAKLKEILAGNPALQNPQGAFIDLKQQLEKSIELCSEFQQLKAAIDAAKDDCPKLSKLRTENPYLQQPEGMFIPLKQTVDGYIATCNEYQTLKESIGKAQDDCDKLQQLASNNPALQNPKDKFVELKTQLNSNQKKCTGKQIENSINQCPGERPEKLAPELVVVFDASGSMAYPADLQKSQRFEQSMAQAGMSFNLSSFLFGRGAAEQQYAAFVRQNSPEKDSRMRAAKTAVKNLVVKTPSDMNLGLVVLKECPAAQKYGFYSPAKRQQFLNSVVNLQPENGTPLGDAIRKAGQMVDGVNKAATMVVISDGEESCKTDPCAVARKLAAQKPYLTINVVDILGTGAGNCIANATRKGKVFTARNMQDVINMTEKAANSAIPKNCKK